MHIFFFTFTFYIHKKCKIGHKYNGKSERNKDNKEKKSVAEGILKK